MVAPFAGSASSPPAAAPPRAANPNTGLALRAAARDRRRSRALCACACAARPRPRPRPSDAAAGGRLPRGVRAAALHGVSAHQPQAPRPARGACGGEWPPVAAPPPPGPLGRPEPRRAGPRLRPGRRRPLLQMEGHLPPSAPALSVRRASGTLPPLPLAPPGAGERGGAGSASELGSRTAGAREALVNPRGIPGIWIFLSSGFPMSQLKNREAEKLCQGHRGRWRRRARRAVPEGSQGGGQRGTGSQPPGPAEAAGNWKVACASDSCQRNTGSDSPGGGTGLL